jgi:arylsulfatase A-like enzyme
VVARDRAERSPASVFLAVSSRVCFGGLVLLTCFYSLFVYLPLTYYTLIQHTFLRWLEIFVKIHPYLYWACLLPLLLSLRRELSMARLRPLVLGFAAVHGLLGIMLFKLPRLDCLPHDFRSLVWSMLMPASLLWLGAIDHLWFAEAGGWRHSVPARSFCWRMTPLAGLLVGGPYALTAALRWSSGGGESVALAAAIWHPLFSHLLFAVLAFSVLSLLSEAATRSGWSNRGRFYALTALLAVWGCLLLLRLMSPSLGLQAAAALAFCAIVSLETTAFISGLNLRWQGPERAHDGLSLALYVFAPLPSSCRLRRWQWAGVSAAIFLLSWGGATVLEYRDWEALLQRLLALLLWTIVIALAAASAAGKRPAERGSLLVPLALVVVSVAGLRLLARQALPAADGGGNRLASVLEQYGQFDASAKAIRDIFSPAAEANGDRALLELLQRSTNIAAPVAPVNISLQKTDKKRPTANRNIFIFVIDSLRQDYVAPYNPAVDFTPQIAAFAADSVVYRNAFTRYGGTALAEPSIWAGAMQPHKQYVQPFHPMNALEKLLDAAGYERYLSMDPVLQAILNPSPDTVILSRGVPFHELDLCRVLEELKQKLISRQDKQRPVFVYTQPANVHTNGLKFGQSHLRPKPHNPNFEPEYATELERVDTALGEFFRFLKEQKMYDDSLIVITSDHGEALGEFGRVGHSGMLYPEVLRIPLIVHFPKRDRPSLVTDPNQIAFNIDITPTIYSLLGYAELQPRELFGRPLFARSRQELDSYLQRDYLVASSYASIYGLLSDNGRRLFVLDAMTGASYFYDLAHDPMGLHNNVTVPILKSAEEKIRDRVLHLNEFYHLSL